MGKKKRIKQLEKDVANLQKRLDKLENQKKSVEELFEEEVKKNPFKDIPQPNIPNPLPESPWDKWPPENIPTFTVCGRCGLKIENNKPFGYVCQHLGCPMGMGPTWCKTSDSVGGFTTSDGTNSHNIKFEEDKTDDNEEIS